MDYTLDYEPDDELDYESERDSADTAEDLIFEVLNNTEGYPSDISDDALWEYMDTLSDAEMFPELEGCVIKDTAALTFIWRLVNYTIKTNGIPNPKFCI
jgi:hypothetical protein